MIQPSKSPDVIIVGAGIFGLWAARRAIRSGRRVVVLERRSVGAGASGGVLGALMPHMPDRWNDKKQFQFEGLACIGEAIAELEADTGLTCGFRRCGRLMPLKHEKMVEAVAERVAAASANWGGRFRMEWIAPPLAGRMAGNWLDEAQAPFGVQYDDLSARLDPRACLDALKAYLLAHGELREGAQAVRLEPEAGRVVLADGGVVSAAEIVVANGFEAFALLQPFMGGLNGGKPIGRGVKGQAVLAEVEHGDDQPIVFSDGTYVVPQAGGRVAIGSTSVDEWQRGSHPDPQAFDPEDTGFVDRAMALVPALRGAEIVERWANVRPRNMIAGMGTEPFLGKVPGHPRLTALIGGFKTSFGVAHLGDAPRLAAGKQ